MTNKAHILRFLGMSLAIAGFVLIGGSFNELTAQNRDPFSKPGWARKPEDGGKGGKLNAPPVNLGAPAIEQRIDYYKRVREAAAANGHSLPKVTSVLTLDEMSVTGIFRTPRGYAAMVEAVPLQLAYTIYPGDKFFDGQLVAVEENRLIFRRVTKVSNGKFVSSVENKPLRKYSERQQIQGTAPVSTDNRASTESSNAPGLQASQVLGSKPSQPIVSPLEEMNRQVPTDANKDKKKETKKTVKVAKSK